VSVGGALADTVEAAGVSADDPPFVHATAVTSASGMRRAGRLRARMDAA
jgi:hypothetical protein